MKKQITTVLAAVALVGSANALTMVTADIVADETWNTAGAPYILTDVISVKDGAVLTIEPGVVVRGEPRSGAPFDPGTLVVTRKSQIEAAGTQASPIIFTTAKVTDPAFNYATATAADYGAATFVDADPARAPLRPGANYSYTPKDTSHLAEEYRGLWGGVIILGNAPTNIGFFTNGKFSATIKGARNDLDDIYEGFVEGLDPNYTLDNDGVYGGTNPNDNSGTMRFVSIRHGGANLAADNEINGLTMAGVGAGTSIEFVEVYCNNDDGFQWFGGTVCTRFLVSLYNKDDSFDISEGFAGFGQFWFSLQLDDGVNGDYSAEHDGMSANFDTINPPFTFATIYNATYHSSCTGKQMLKFQNNSYGDYYNSVFVGSDDKLVDDITAMGLSIASDNCDFVSNSTFYNINGNIGELVDHPSNILYDSGTGTISDISNTPDMALIIRGNDNRFDGENPLPGITNVRGGVDPRTSILAIPETLKSVPQGGCLTPAGYLGAFDPVDFTLWTDGWSVFSAVSI